MAGTTTYGYLERPYLIDSYLAGLGVNSQNVQFDRKVFALARARTQVNRKITKSALARAQYSRRIVRPGDHFYVQVARKISTKNVIRVQFNRQSHAIKRVGVQYDRRIVGLFAAHVQYWRMIKTSRGIHFSVMRQIKTKRAIRAQFRRVIASGGAVKHTVIKRGTVWQAACGGYLTDAYLMGPYLAPQTCAHMRLQFSRKIYRAPHARIQYDRKSKRLQTIHVQFQRQIKTALSLHMQYMTQTTRFIHVQFLRSIYNTNLLRVLYDFASRGETGTNWTVVAGGQMAGDFSINNVNNDIVEYAYRSQATSITVQCDTQITQGAFVDTLGILNHNFTSSVSILFQGSQDPGFSSVLFSTGVPYNKENCYWIAPTLPQVSYRYWRLVISDPTNTDGFLQLGTVVFGSALIMNMETFTDEVSKRKIHYADRVRTAGFSNVSNDRALKKAFTLNFRRLLFGSQNYNNLTNMFDYVRTSLKALWIPTPQYPDRFAAFGKLTEIPEEQHLALGKTNDYIDFTINVDESQ